MAGSSRSAQRGILFVLVQGVVGTGASAQRSPSRCPVFRQDVFAAGIELPQPEGSQQWSQELRACSGPEYLTMVRPEAGSAPEQQQGVRRERVRKSACEPGWASTRGRHAAAARSLLRHNQPAAAMRNYRNNPSVFNS